MSNYHNQDLSILIDTYTIKMKEAFAEQDGTLGITYWWAIEGFKILNETP